jgi:hypothetical protein
VKLSEWINITLAYVITVAVVNLVIHLIGYNRPAIALISGAVLGTEVAAWSWQVRKACAAPIRLKLWIGGLIATLSLMEGLAFQLIFRWMSRPAATIGVIAISCLLLPPLTFEAFRNTMPVRKGK